ncbi:hypothetical protein F5Y16DRAFT_404493 [Xylariaceae sp. FL0255]|nr:hypothetical protein F5Y16DRAFT_404493 [Xylariaceae sp. FL0255]
MKLTNTVFTALELCVALLPQPGTAWLVQLWDTQPNCATSGGGGADTERGGVPCQQECGLLGLLDVQSMLITDWDDNCTVSLYPQGDEAPCMNAPVWEKSKEEVAQDGELVANNWTYQVGLSGKGTIYMGYSCGRQ